MSESNKLEGGDLSSSEVRDCGEMLKTCTQGIISTSANGCFVC